MIRNSIKVGFIFLYAGEIKPNYAKERLIDKLLLSDISILNCYNLDKHMTKLVPCLKALTNNTILELIKKHFNINSKHIFDFNPIYRKKLETFNENNEKTIIYSVILNPTTSFDCLKDQIVISSNTKVLLNKHLCFYNINYLDTISYDLFSSVLNFYKQNPTYLKVVETPLISFDSFIRVSLLDIIESLCGLVEIRDSTKHYLKVV